MKTYIVIYNKNSRGKKYTREQLKSIFISHNMDSKIFVTKQIHEVDLIIKKYTDPEQYIYCGIGGDGTLNSLINALLKNNIKKPTTTTIIPI